MSVGNNPTSDLAAIRSNIASSLNRETVKLTKSSLPGHTAIRLELTSNNNSTNTVIAPARKVKTVSSTLINKTTSYEVTVSKTNIFTRIIRKLRKGDETFKVTIKSKIQDQGGYQVTIFKLTKETIEKITNNSQPNPASSPRQRTSLSMRTNIPQSVLEEFEPDESTIEGGKVPPEFKPGTSVLNEVGSNSVFSDPSLMRTIDTDGEPKQILQPQNQIPSPVPQEFTTNTSVRFEPPSDSAYGGLLSIHTMQSQEETGDGLVEVLKSFDPNPETSSPEQKSPVEPNSNQPQGRTNDGYANESLDQSSSLESQNDDYQPLTAYSPTPFVEQETDKLPGYSPENPQGGPNRINTGYEPDARPTPLFPDLLIGDPDNQGPPDLAMPIRNEGREFNVNAPDPYKLETEFEPPAASPVSPPRTEQSDAVNVAHGISQSMTEDMIKRQIQQANVSQNLGLTEEKISKYAQAILAGGDRAIAEAKQSGTKTIVDTDIEGIQIMATKKGALFVKISSLGEGAYKDTYKFVQIFGEATRPLAANSQARKSAAIGEFKPITNQPTEEMQKITEQEKQNELKIHTRLTTKRRQIKSMGKQDPLPNLATGKKVRRKTVNNMSEEAITLKLYNGGDVDGLLDGQMSPRERSSICRDAMKGVAQLHKEGVIHRDLKSDNLLFEEVDQILPKEQWPDNLDPQNPPEGYSITLNLNGTIESVSKKERHVVVTDLGKATPYKPGERYPTGGGFAFHQSIRPPFLDADQAFSPAFDIFAAGRMVYQIFADIPIATLSYLPPIKKEHVPLVQQAIANWTDSAETREKLDERKKELERRSYGGGLTDDIINELSEIGKKIQLVNLTKNPVLIPQNWANWGKIPPKVQDFILKMVDLDPAKRPTAEECVQFFENLTDEELNK